VRAWLGKGWFHPPELARAAVVDRFTGIYLPFWTFDARIDSEWKAEVGYERQERYYDAGDKEWKTRTVIDWRWERGQVSVSVDDLLVDGTAHASRVLLERLRPYPLNELVAYAPEFLAGRLGTGKNPDARDGPPRLPGRYPLLPCAQLQHVRRLRRGGLAICAAACIPGYLPL
jgi:hypothetical protein